MAAKKDPGEALTKTSGDSLDASSRPPEGTPSAPSVNRPVRSVHPVVRQGAQVGPV